MTAHRKTLHHLEERMLTVGAAVAAIDAAHLDAAQRAAKARADDVKQRTATTKETDSE